MEQGDTGVHVFKVLSLKIYVTRTQISIGGGVQDRDTLIEHLSDAQSISAMENYPPIMYHAFNKVH